MLKINKLLSAMFLMGSLIVSNITVFASEPTYNDKQLFVDNILATKEIKQNIDSNIQNDINEVLLKYVSNDIDGALEIINATKTIAKIAEEQNLKSSYDILEEYLNANNVYIYSVNTEAVQSRSVGAQDVQMNSVVISYNASNGTWAVTGGGYWKTTSYENDAPAPSLISGAKDVGGMEAVGFALMNTSGTIPTLVSSSGYVHDGHGRDMTLTNPYNSDSSKGLVFQYQDQIYYSDDISDVCYMGYGFAAQGIYTSDFANYHGRARSYYAHTWNTCAINSIGISLDGFSASWSDSTYGWEIYNNSDKVF